MTLSVEPATPADISPLMEIVRAAFPAPWPEEVFHKEFTRDWARIFMARDAGRQIAGFVHFWQVPGELQILNIAVSPPHRRQGVASRLLQFTLEFGRAHGCTSFALEVREGNLAAQRLYEKHGFRRVGLRKQYYEDNGENAVVMVLRLEDHE